MTGHQRCTKRWRTRLERHQHTPATRTRIYRTDYYGARGGEQASCLFRPAVVVPPPPPPSLLLWRLLPLGLTLGSGLRKRAEEEEDGQRKRKRGEERRGEEKRKGKEKGRRRLLLFFRGRPSSSFSSSDEFLKPTTSHDLAQ